MRRSTRCATRARPRSSASSGRYPAARRRRSSSSGTLAASTGSSTIFTLPRASSSSCSSVSSLEPALELTLTRRLCCRRTGSAPSSTPSTPCATPLAPTTSTSPGSPSSSWSSASPSTACTTRARPSPSRPPRPRPLTPAPARRRRVRAATRARPSSSARGRRSSSTARSSSRRSPSGGTPRACARSSSQSGRRRRASARSRCVSSSRSDPLLVEREPESALTPLHADDRPLHAVPPAVVGRSRSAVAACVARRRDPARPGPQPSPPRLEPGNVRLPLSLSFLSLLFAEQKLTLSRSGCRPRTRPSRRARTRSSARWPSGCGLCSCTRMCVPPPLSAPHDSPRLTLSVVRAVARRQLEEPVLPHLARPLRHGRPAQRQRHGPVALDDGPRARPIVRPHRLVGRPRPDRHGAPGARRL